MTLLITERTVSDFSKSQPQRLIFSRRIVIATCFLACQLYSHRSGCNLPVVLRRRGNGWRRANHRRFDFPHVKVIDRFGLWWSVRTRTRTAQSGRNPKLGEYPGIQHKPSNKDCQREQKVFHCHSPMIVRRAAHCALCWHVLRGIRPVRERRSHLRRSSGR